MITLTYTLKGTDEVAQKTTFHSRRALFLFMERAHPAIESWECEGRTNENNPWFNVARNRPRRQNA